MSHYAGGVAANEALQMDALAWWRQQIGLRERDVCERPASLRALSLACTNAADFQQAVNTVLSRVYGPNHDISPRNRHTGVSERPGQKTLVSSVLAGRDVVCSYLCGRGKTAAILAAAWVLSKADRGFVVVLAPLTTVMVSVRDECARAHLNADMVTAGTAADYVQSLVADAKRPASLVIASFDAVVHCPAFSAFLYNNALGGLLYAMFVDEAHLCFSSASYRHVFVHYRVRAIAAYTQLVLLSGTLSPDSVPLLAHLFSRSVDDCQVLADPDPADLFRCRKLIVQSVGSSDETINGVVSWLKKFDQRSVVVAPTKDDAVTISRELKERLRDVDVSDAIVGGTSAESVREALGKQVVVGTSMVGVSVNVGANTVVVARAFYSMADLVQMVCRCARNQDVGTVVLLWDENAFERLRKFEVATFQPEHINNVYTTSGVKSLMSAPSIQAHIMRHLFHSPGAPELQSATARALSPITTPVQASTTVSAVAASRHLGDLRQSQLSNTAQCRQIATQADVQMSRARQRCVLCSQDKCNGYLCNGTRCPTWTMAVGAHARLCFRCGCKNCHPRQHTSALTLPDGMCYSCGVLLGRAGHNQQKCSARSARLTRDRLMAAVSFVRLYALRRLQRYFPELASLREGSYEEFVKRLGYMHNGIGRIYEIMLWSLTVQGVDQ